jgi:hypothetical protein
VASETKGKRSGLVRGEEEEGVRELGAELLY